MMMRWLLHDVRAKLLHILFCLLLLNIKVGMANQHQLIQGWALAAPDGPWRLTFAPRRLEKLNLSCFHRNQQQCWAPWISQVQSRRTPSSFH